jgi:hypothetical protein
LNRFVKFSNGFILLHKAIRNKAIKINPFWFQKICFKEINLIEKEIAKYSCLFEKKSETNRKRLEIFNEKRFIN